MSCFSIPHLLKRNLWRNLMLWVYSQTPKKGISPKLLKNNVKGRSRHHKKRNLRIRLSENMAWIWLAAE